MKIYVKGFCFTFVALMAGAALLSAAVRGHSTMYVGGTVTSIKKGAKGRLNMGDASLEFNAGKGSSLQIPYDQITAMDYGEHVGRRVAAAIIVAWPLLFSHKKRHYLTVYFNRDAAQAAKEREEIAKNPSASPVGDVAGFEINKHDYEDIIDGLQAKTGLTVKQESVKH